MKKALAALLTLLLLSGLSAPAMAGRVYSDLPTDHWAYASMDRAYDLGILAGYPDGTMHPDADLTWGQSLLMLARAFYPPVLLTHPPVDGRHWAAPAYLTARELGVLDLVDFLPVAPDGLDRPITRQDMAVLLDRVLRRVFSAEPATADPADMNSADWDSLPEPYRASVLQCYARGVVTGYADGRFGGNDVLTRAAGTALMVRTLALVEEPGEDEFPPDTTSPIPIGDTAASPSDLTALGSNRAKLIRLYGNADQRRYLTEADAEAAMTTVTVPVWNLNRTTGAKTPSTCTFRVNSALAEEMSTIFAEIYNDLEQFPIYEIGGYDWRGDSALGEHNCGTAIDINANENYQVYSDGRVGAGSHWTPGEDPHSIPESGSLVRVFRAHGYSWGGNAWPTNKDYMHFSYLGL